MIKMNSLISDIQRKNMEERFIKSLYEMMDEAEINDLIVGATFNGARLDLKKILTAPFDELNGISGAIKIYFLGNDAGYTIFTEKLNYTDHRHLLYNFFIQEDINGHLNLCSCFYCNIDFINVYDNRGGISIKWIS